MSTVTISLVLLASAAGADPKVLARPEMWDPLVNPPLSKCVDESLQHVASFAENDRALCVIRPGDEAIAVPIRQIMHRHPVVSLPKGVFVFDPEAGFVRGFRAGSDLQFHGWRGGVMTLRQPDGTLYSSLTGLAFDGPKKGERLPQIPTVSMNWNEWTRRRPGSSTIALGERFRPQEVSTAAREASRSTRGPADPRLAADEWVVGIWDGKQARAFRLADFTAPRLRMADDVAVFTSHSGRLATAFTLTAELFAEPEKPGLPARRLDAKTVKLGRVGEHPWSDVATGSGFDDLGRGISGSLQGFQLAAADAVVVKWWAWSMEHPDTAIVD